MADREIRIKIIIDGRESTAALRLTDKSIQGLGDTVSDVGKKTQGLQTRLARLGLAVQGVREAASLLRATFGEAIRAFDEQVASNRRLEAASKLTGASLDDMQATAAEARESFSLTTAQANGLVIELTKLGQQAGDVSKTGEAIERLLDLAAAQGLGAEEALQAISQAILGIDEGTDKLFSKNPSAIYAEYARQIGTTAGKLDEQQKKQALLDAVLKGGERVREAYLEYLQSGAGEQQQFNKALEDAQVKAGELLREALGPVLETGTDVLELFLDLPEAIQETVLAVGIATTAFKTLNAVGLIPTKTALDAIKKLLGTGGIAAGLRGLASVIGPFLVAVSPALLQDFLEAQEAERGAERLEALREEFGKLSEAQRNALLIGRQKELTQAIFDVEAATKAVQEAAREADQTELRRASNTLRAAKIRKAQLEDEVALIQQLRANPPPPPSSDPPPPTPPPQPDDERLKKERELQQLMIDLMQEGIERELAQIELEFERRKDLIRKKFPEVADELIRAADEARRLAIDKATDQSIIASLPEVNIDTLTDFSEAVRKATEDADAAVQEHLDRQGEAAFESIRLAQEEEAAQDAKRQAYIGSSAAIAMSLANQVDSARDALNAIRALIKQEIQAYVAKAIAGVIAKEFSSKGLLGAITAGLGAAAVGLAFETLVPKFATGGLVTGPGGPTDDRVLARLSPGEFVMPAAQTRQHLPALQAMRAGASAASGDNALVHEIRALRADVQRMKLVMPIDTLSASLERKARRDRRAGFS